MSDKTLTYNCRLELTKDEPKTSTNIGLEYSPARADLYEKKPMPRVPKIRGSSYDVNSIYIPTVGSTYDDTFKTYVKPKVFPQTNEYLKYGKNIRPMVYGLTEYKEEFEEKELPADSKGINIEKSTTCPMNTAERDERDPLPLTQNFNKYLDIYLSETRLAHRAFTLREQNTIAMKDIVTTQESMNIPKGRGFGCKFQALPGQDLDKRDKNMFDKSVFPEDPKVRYMPKGMPRVPNFGSETETQAAFKKPEGCGLNHLFDRFFEFTTTINAPTAKQTLCAPGMYKTESSVISNHSSPQTVV